ncbi:altronate dehydratase family protein [Flavobacteriaceae bacterium]|jgi:altronate hydrolase|nr:altronate dehydratase family protein [Flavobacteriaceae bacterium]MDG1723144.1 altronate dehydratase family protein [Flavobacteriaceae bacterium]MDG2290071.1 altronate dehydratase family protein [Flavobacteriaceae bacterium]
MSHNNILRIHPKDNVFVALTNLSKGDNVEVDANAITLVTDIAAKHKFAMRNFAVGEEIYMYGVVVGKAKNKIVKGEVITTQNIVHETEAYKVPKKSINKNWTAPKSAHFSTQTFLGYYRDNGRVGTENNWLVIPLVFCQNRNIETLQNTIRKGLGYENPSKQSFDMSVLIDKYKSGASEQELMRADLTANKQNKQKNPLFPNVDGIHFLTHDGGCGGSTSDAVTLCNLLAGYINNPNVAGATILSLGCQHAQMDILERALKRIAPDSKKPVYFLEQQQSSSEPEYIAEAIKKTFVGLIQANKISRAPAPLSKLTIGLECGGSDGFSGISANPTLGYVSDLVIGLGGAAILSEFPELNGVEQELINRCVDVDKAQKFAQIMKAYNTKASALGAGFYANPSPGNIKDGLITDAIKSAGAAKKGGSSPIVDVLDYTEQLVKPGLNLLCTPGNDVESTTGLAGSGANIILFTTGLGTPTGNPAVPVIKVSTNTAVYSKMHDIIDFNTGDIIDGKETIESCGEALLSYIIKVASGEDEVNARRLGQNDFIPWKRGLSL